MKSIAAVLTASCLFGCVGPSTDFGKIKTKSTGDLFQMDGWNAKSNQPISQTQVDELGINKQARGQFMDMSVVIPLMQGENLVYTETTTTYPDGTVVTEEVPTCIRLFSSDPTNSSLTGFKAALPNGVTIDIAAITHDNEKVIAAYDKQVIAALETEGVITKEQAALGKALADSGVKLADIFAQLGIKAFIPGS